MVDNFPEFCFSVENPSANATITIPAKMKMAKDAKQNTVFLATIVFSQHNNWWRTTGYEMEEESGMSGCLKLLISSQSDVIVTTQDTTNIHIKLLVDIFPKRKGSLQNKFLVKVGILAQGGGGASDPIPTFFQNRPKPNLPWKCP